MSTFHLDDLGALVAQGFAADGVPCEVRYGRELGVLEAAPPATLELVEDPGSDRFGPPQTAGGNPRALWAGTRGALAIIHCRSPEPGAGEREHRALANSFLHAFLRQLARWRDAAKSPAMTAAGGFVSRPDGELDDGARYVLRFAIGETVRDRTWAEVSGLTPTGTGVAVINGTEHEAC